MFNKKTLRDIDVSGKRALVRVDFNVPLSKDRKVVDDTRIKSSLPTIRYLLDKGARVIIISHLGRPGGKFDPEVTLDPVADALSGLLGRKVRKVDKTVSHEVEREVEKMKAGDILVLENIRFNPAEKENDEEFAKKLATLGDIFINDAFGTSHREHASTVGVTKFLPAVSGFLMEKEIETLSKLLESPKKPFYVVLGGNKCSDKIRVIENFINVVEGILIGGGMCFTFLKALGYEIGRSICQDDFVDKVKMIMKKAELKKVKMLLPVDVVVAREIDENSEYKIVEVKDIPSDWIGVDIGPKTIQVFQEELEKAKTIFWNGPMGVF
ncbi:MAG: phosphoglycerate kinase, partial [Actinomycetia bacterium]|nr:phosphoglycerate kinase [Actinomycetes bacterium]